MRTRRDRRWNDRFSQRPYRRPSCPASSGFRYSQIPEEVSNSSAQFLAREMVRAGTYVDTVLVEDDSIRPMDQAATNVLTLRSVARLKGNSADRFSLSDPE